VERRFTETFSRPCGGIENFTDQAGVIPLQGIVFGYPCISAHVPNVTFVFTPCGVVNMSAQMADLLEVEPLTAPRSELRADPSGSVDERSRDLIDESTSPKKVSRRSLFRRALGLGAFTAASGVYGREIEPFWVHWHDVPMPIRGLDRAFAGFRIAHLTDLHAGTEVPLSYLKKVVDRVKRDKPDLVVVTGDLVNHCLEAVIPISELLGEISAQASIPVIASLGNHDYDITSASVHQPGMPTRIADALERELTRRNITLLRNRAVPFTHGDGRLWFVGLEDLWSGRFCPQLAFAGVTSKDPVIALSHNPDTAVELDGYGVQWTLSGHTHGGQVRIPGFGAVLLNVQNHQLEQGQFNLPNSHLYVSRGVGFLKQVRFFCRPEIPTFVLREA
jgi:predicted MPP superfamily phosphohydrolase